MFYVSLMIATLFAATPPVPTRADAIVETIHGVPVADPYRWLEKADTPEVKAWTDAQNAFMRKALDAYPGRKALEARLWQLYETGSLGIPEVRGGGARRYFYLRRDGKQNQPVLYVRDGVEGADRALVDVNALTTDGTRALDWWFPSDDGKRVAYGVSPDGDEKSTLRVHDVATGQDLPDTITRTRACSLAWRPDGKGFYYTRYPARGVFPPGEEEYHRSVYYHALGTDPEKDAKVFGAGRDLKDWPSVKLSSDGRWLAIEVGQGWAKSEVYVIDTRAGGKGAPKAIPIVEGKNALFNVIDVVGDRLYLHTNEGAPRYRLYTVDLRKPGTDRAAWREVIPQSDDILENVTLSAGRIAALYLKDASSRVRLFAADGKPIRELPLPGIGTVSGLHGRWESPELFHDFVSFLTPTAIHRHDLGAAGGSGSGAGVVWRRLAAPVDAAAYEVQQQRFSSRDGTSVPLFLVHKKGLPRDGKNPTLLYGYGGFNISLTPAFATALIPFLEKGGVYAVANLRGGAEYGETWHQAGMLSRKQNTFDDFVAAAQHLITTKVTSRERLAVSGRSNGGLLIGAAVTQRPDLFRAAVCGVPLLDMIRYHKFRIAQLWIPEYGSADDPEQFKWLYAYSPYHRVKDGGEYPAMLIFTAESDSRVDPMHARKMTARLQAATASRRPVLLRLETKAGHGAGKPLAKVIAQVADEWSFLLTELGVR